VAHRDGLRRVLQCHPSYLPEAAQEKHVARKTLDWRKQKGGQGQPVAFWPLLRLVMKAHKPLVVIHQLMD
jgi:hypothetical protein